LFGDLSSIPVDQRNNALLPSARPPASSIDELTRSGGQGGHARSRTVSARELAAFGLDHTVGKDRGTRATESFGPGKISEIDREHPVRPKFARRRNFDRKREKRCRWCGSRSPCTFESAGKNKIGLLGGSSVPARALSSERRQANLTVRERILFAAKSRADSISLRFNKNADRPSVSKAKIGGHAGANADEFEASRDRWASG